MSILPRILTISAILVTAGFAVSPRAERSDEGKLLTQGQMDVARELIDAHKCPCRCGRYLPGSTRGAACFGCSVGRWETSFIVERLAAGESRGNIVLHLAGAILINVFADYDDPALPEVWERTRRIADEYDIDRVVLRPMGQSQIGLTAVTLVEYAREHGKFMEMNERLITHDGPWDGQSMLGLAQEMGLSADDAKTFMRRADVTAQINKNREHAQSQALRGLPAVTIGARQVVGDSDALRRAIREATLDESM